MGSSRIAAGPWTSRRRLTCGLPLRLAERGELRGEEDVRIVAEHHLREGAVPALVARLLHIELEHLQEHRVAAGNGIVDEADAFALGLRFRDAGFGLSFRLGKAGIAFA